MPVSHLLFAAFNGRVVRSFGVQNVEDWRSGHLGRGALPRDLSGLEIEASSTYSELERQVIDDERCTASLKLALALQIGLLRMISRWLEALRVVPPALWRHPGTRLDTEAPDPASLRTMYRRRTVWRSARI